MITLTRENYVAYHTLKNTENLLVFYKDLFTGPIINKVNNTLNTSKNDQDVQKTIDCLSMGLEKVSDIVYIRSNYKQGGVACINLRDGVMNFDGEKIDYKKGSVMFFGKNFLERHGTKIMPIYAIHLYNRDYLPAVYLDTQTRLEFGDRVAAKLSENRLPDSCIQKRLELELLGSGSFANVFKSRIGPLDFAVKLSKVDKNELEDNLDKVAKIPDTVVKRELYILKKIIKPLIVKGICPNLPLLFMVEICKKCKIVIKDEKITTACLTYVMELGNGTIRNFFEDYLPNIKHELVTKHVNVALFQVMAALYTLQHYAQLMHFDIKKENILVYDTEPGGYWEYVIRGKRFFVPNLGKLFVLNDFGLSRSMSPKYPMLKSGKDPLFRVGSRYGAIHDNKIYPIITEEYMCLHGECEVVVKSGDKVTWVNKNGDNIAETRGGELHVKPGTSVVEDIIIFPKEIENRENFLDNPDVFPPFEFYNDTQDVIRIFAGGKRSTQKGSHGKVDIIPKKMKEELKMYKGPGENTKAGTFTTNPAQLSAGYFILSYFKNIFTTEPEKSFKISTYRIS